MSVPMPVTMRIIIPDSGSSRNPHSTWNIPTVSLLVASGIDGIHCAMTTSYSRASPGRPSSCQNDSSDSPRAATIIVQATTPAVLREKYRMPSRPLIAAPIPGNSGISQMYFISALPSCPSCLPRPSCPSLPSHQVHFVDVDAFLVPVEREDDAQADGGFCRSNGDHENRKDLADGVLQLARERHQVDVHRVQDQLDRHEDDDDVPAHHHPDDADDEQRHGKQHVMGWRDHEFVH